MLLNIWTELSEEYFTETWDIPVSEGRKNYLRKFTRLIRVLPRKFFKQGASIELQCQYPALKPLGQAVENFSRKFKNLFPNFNQLYVITP
jgi:hypothetical protein